MAEGCPRCGFADLTGERCPRCGVYVTAYRASLEAMRRGPVLRPAAGPPASAATAAPGAAPPSATATRRLTFHGSAGALLGLAVTNVLLILLTLGIYFFWAKARMRRYLLGETELEGDRFAYHGTGRELLLGFTRGLVVIFIPVALLSVLPAVYGAPPPVRHSLSTLLWLLGLLLMPVAMVGARRYRLSRTSWRGIRFSFRGRLRDFVQLFVVGTRAQLAHARPLLPDLLHAPPEVHGVQRLVRLAEVRLRRPRPRAGVAVRADDPAVPAHAGAVVVLVLGAPAALLHRPHPLRPGALPLHDRRRRAGLDCRSATSSRSS